MSDLVQLVYVSRATREIGLDELTLLLEKARKRNREMDLTGMLLFDGSSFMQVLEGDQAAVAELYQHIQKDSRHDSVSLIYETRRKQREFPDWSMGFKNLTAEMIASTEGLNDFFSDRTCLADMDRSRAIRILEYFTGDER